jgi:hypothetical protein
VHVAQLNGFTEEGQYVGTGSGRVCSNQYVSIRAPEMRCNLNIFDT